MIRYIYIILIFVCQLSFGQIENLFKYSTFYTSMSMGSPMVERDDYIAIDKGYEDVTLINPFDYNLTIGLRKIARMDYEYKVKTWYYGTEDNVADNVTIGNALGWEYLFNYSFIRNRGDKFTEQNFWLRYLGNKYVTKIQYTDNQRVKLKYTSFDARYRVSAGNFDFTIGGLLRVHPVYGIVPIEDFWVPGENTFTQLAEDFGYSTEFVDGDWHWFEGDYLIATSDDEFYNWWFGDAVASFNERELDKLGLQKEISLVIGGAYYKWTERYWVHLWANIMPIHKGLDDYSYEYGDGLDMFDWDSGAVIGCRINKNLGLFIEGTHIRYWGKNVFDVKFGFNYLIF